MFQRPRPVFCALACLAATGAPAHAALMINTDLGALGVGSSTNLTGNTAAGANNADSYTSTGANGAVNWGNEVVYRFTVSESVLASVTDNGISAGDPDFFLLSGLRTTVNGAKNDAADGIAFAFLDGGGTESLAVVGAGTYFLSVDSFIGFDGGVTPGDATFDILLELAAAPAAPTATDLGILGSNATNLVVDTLGSNYDTELALWDALGNLLFENDDAEAGLVFQSLIDTGDPLRAGTYYLSLGGWDTEWSVGFGATGTGTDSGNYLLNFPGGSAGGTAASDETLWFTFSIVPEPETSALLALAGLALLRHRRA